MMHARSRPRHDLPGPSTQQRRRPGPWMRRSGGRRSLSSVSDLEARGVVRKAGHAVLIIIVILIVLGVLLGVGLTAMFRRRR